MKFSSSQRNLLSIFALCVLAFWGFGSIFSDLNLSISAEIATAAFGALFIILTTKFLMEQENDAKRKEFIFQQNVNLYIKYAELQMKSIEDGKITKEEINEIKLCHAYLLITGSDGSIKHSIDFLTKAIEASRESNGQQIPESKRSELVKCTADFLLAARSGLYLPNDNIDADKQKDLFLRSEENARKIRQVVNIEENRDYKNKSEEGKKITDRFIKKIEEWGYHIRILESEISVYPTKEFKWGTAIIFIRSSRDGFTAKSFFASEVEAFAQINEIFSDLNPRADLYKKGEREQIQIAFSFKNSLLNDQERLERLRQMLDSLKELRDKIN
jgi:hypothetical protein